MLLREAGALGVVGDVVVDLECECEGGAAGFAGDAWRGAVLHGMEEVFYFEAQGFAFGDVGLGEGEACGGMRRVGCGCRGLRKELSCELRVVSDGAEAGDEARVDVDGEKLLAGEVEREVLVRLEETELADLLGGDAAGGEVGDAAGFELDADVGDVGLSGEDGDADSADFFYG